LEPAVCGLNRGASKRRINNAGCHRTTRQKRVDFVATRRDAPDVSPDIPTHFFETNTSPDTA